MSIKTLFATVFVLLISVSISMAQDTPSLRDLADQNELFVGAAVYTSHLGDEEHFETLGSQFNMLTPENEAKMCVLQPRRGLFDFRQLDRLVEFAEAHNMTVRGHTLLWHNCLPDWVTDEEFTRDQAIGLLRDHIYTVVGRYRGRIPIWDVVNEAIDGSTYRRTPWYNLIGEEYVELAFQFAHDADPDAVLFYNDYGAEGMNAKANAIYEMVTDLVTRGVPIHGVGLQAHLTVGDTLPGRYASQANLAQNMQRIADLGLEVQITEMDVKYQGDTTPDILERQAGDYYRVMQTCLEQAACTAFVAWGVTDRLSWLRDPQWGSNPTVEPLLFDSEYEPKPAYFALIDALARAVGAEPVMDDADVAAILGIEEAAPVVVEIPAPTMSDPAQLAPDPVDGVAYYAPFPVSITLDGDISDWANIPTVSLGDSDSADSESITFAAAADENNLYFMADVRDPHIIAGIRDAASGWYQEDSVEFYLNTTGDLNLGAYAPGVAQIGLMAVNMNNPETPQFGGNNSGDSDVRMVVVQTDSGYRVEATVPLVNDAWTITPAHLATIGFQVHLNGASSAEAPQSTKLIWSAADTQDQSWQNPSVFGRLIFWDVNQAGS